ncbi:hypothetical protein [Micromonospora sp. 15K316]|nr:hypothetical protein [Micromonospora sp. 15K316]
MAVVERVEGVFARAGVEGNLHVVDLDHPGEGRTPVAGRSPSGRTSRW